MIFGWCQCRHTPIPLPDADPYDKWDKELEEGDTILAISFEEAIRIRSIWHVANDDEPRLPWQRQHQLKTRLDELT